MLDKFKDECGVFGIYGHPEAANLAYLGLYALQHRGQESAGIAAADGVRIRVSKGMGHVNDVFDGSALTHVTGSIAVGHVRYSTAGESRLANAQPIVIDSAHGQLALCHNGNLVNAGEVKDALVREGAIFQTSTDSEVVVHLFARSREKGAEAAIVDALAQVRGAFSLVMMTADKLIGVRDPYGFRPLALGRLNDSWVICSETCALDLIGATYVRDVEPGEMVVASAAGLTSSRPFAPVQNAQQCVFEHVYFARPDSYVFGESVNEVRTELGRRLARETGVPVDVVVPIPDSGVCAAVGYAEAAGLPMRMGLDPQPLRRAHVHPAAAVDPPLRRPGEAEPGEEHPRGPPRGAGGRLDCARHDQPEDRSHGAQRRGARGAHAHQLPADHLALLLRRGHASALGVDCRHAHAGGDSPLSGRRQRGLSQHRGPDRRGARRLVQILHVLLHGRLSRGVPARRERVPAAGAEVERRGQHTRRAGASPAGARRRRAAGSRGGGAGPRQPLAAPTGLSMDYKASGVDIDAGNETVRRIRGLARSTFTSAVLSDIGSFGGLFRFDAERFRDPVLVASADGVGTKLKVAFLANRHDTVGADLVNHCVNDILVQGAEPLFFLDYLATGSLSPSVAEAIVGGMAAACRENSCALLGGETAEMPGFYADGEYDIAGFIVGAVRRERLITGRGIAVGDVLVGVPSSGLHTNGYSLARRIVFEHLRLTVDAHVPELGRTLGDALLEPHRSYLSIVHPLLEGGRIKGMAHITGGGITDNLPRVLPHGTGAVVRTKSWDVPPMFRFLQDAGRVNDDEMRRTFNMGIGLIIVTAADNAEALIGELAARGGRDARMIGEITSASDPTVTYS